MTRLLIFPLVLLVTNPRRLAKTFWKARILANGQWSSYSGFRPLYAINFLFYWTQTLNFDRYGRSGRSPNVSAGNYHLGDWWHLSLTSGYLFSRIGSMLPILCMLGWLGSQFVWLRDERIEPAWLLGVVVLALASSYFYAATFVFLNYNALGWMFMPLGLYATMEGYYWAAGVAWLAASIGSITAILIACMICLSWSIVSSTILPIVAILPALIKLTSHFVFVENIKRSVVDLAKSIGLTSKVSSTAKYEFRSLSSRLFRPDSIQFLSSGVIFFGVCHYIDRNEGALLVLAVLFLWVVNAGIARFADQQSLYMAMFTVATAVAINSSTWVVLGAYWLVVSPLPWLISAATGDRNWDCPKAYGPFNIQQYIRLSNEFLSTAPKGSRILLALDDPQGDYMKVFDGYRIIYEIAFYTGNLRETLVFPDWHAIAEYNKVGDIGFWGREVSAVRENVRVWKADYVLVYQESGSKLNEKWELKGFTNEGNLDWGEIVAQGVFDDEVWPRTCMTPKWFLLKSPRSDQ